MSKHHSLHTLAFVLLVMTMLSGCNDAPSDNVSKAGTNDTNKAITLSDLNKAKNTDGLCALDSIDGVVASSWTVKKSPSVKLAGWVSSSTKGVPAQFTLVLKGDQIYGFAGKFGVARPDVAQAYASPALGSSGFGIDADFSSIQPGVYQTLALSNVATGNESCNFQHQITVTH